MSYQQQQDLITTSLTSTVDYYTKDNDLYLKYFLIDSSFNSRGFSVDPSQLERIAKQAIGKPFTDYEDFPITRFGDGHPWSMKEKATYKDHVLYAMQNATGIIVDFSNISDSALKSASGEGQDIQNNHGYYVTIKVLDEEKKQKYLEDPSRIPKVSPGIYDYDYDFSKPLNNTINLKNIDLVHLAGVKKGAYGEKARVYAKCQGGYECINHLKGASDYNSSLGETSQNNTSDNIMVDNPSNPTSNNSTIDNGNAVATMQQPQQQQQQEIPQQSQQTQQEVTNNSNSNKEQNNNATNNPTNNQITGNPIERLKSKYISESNNNKQGQTNFKEDPDYKKLLLEHEELKKKVDLEDKRRFYAELIPKEVFIINGKFNQEGYNKEIEKAIDKNLDPDLAKEYYNLKLNNIRLNNKIGKPYGASFAVDLSGTNNNNNDTKRIVTSNNTQSYRTPDSVPEVKGASDIHSSQFQSIINIRKMFGSLNNAGGSV